jgi:PAS domain S-box
MALQEERKETIRLLHVDDSLDFAEMATTFLERENDRFDTEAVASATDGLARLADSSFDCVISDYDMPTQDGIEFLKSVREEWPDLPFILFTGKGSEKVASKAISAGVTDYLQKSSGTEQYELLAHRITNAVEQSQAQRRVQEKQQRVHKEQQRLRTLFDRLSQPTVEVQYENDEPIVTQVNSAFEDVFGVESDSIVGDSLDTHIVPDDRIDEAEAINQHVRAGGRLKSREVLRETADGLRKFLLQNAVYSDDDRVGGFAIYTDITDRREREEMLERNRSLLRHTEQLATVGGWEADIETGEISWTQGTYAIHDLDPAGEFEPSIETGMEFYHPDDQATIQQAVEKCRTQGRAYEVDVRLITAEGEQKWVRTTGEAVYDGDDGDDITHIRGAIRNITDIQAQKQELAELKKQYQTLGENFPDGAVYLIDDNFEYVRARGESLEQADLSPADIEGHTPHEVFPDELADEACKHYEQAFNGNTTAIEQEYRGEHYRVRVTPVDGNGNTTKTNTDTEITRVMAVAQDITQYVENRRELQRQNEQLDEFASVVSHDLRNPLTVAEGNLELLREGRESDRIDKIDSALTRMDELIEDLLTLARANEQIGSVESVNLAELSQNCWQNVETTNATIHLDISATQTVTVKADANRLAQVFENLMRNAIEHARESGSG